MASWNETSKAGFDFEDFCLKDINEKKNPLAYRNMKKEEYSFYDIVLFDGNLSENHVQKTIECKFDERAHETGNIFIETGCNGRWSGLLITKADYWQIGDGYEMYLIEKHMINKCIVEHPEITYKKNFPVKQESDNVTKHMTFYLIPKTLFREYCLEVSEIDKMTYEKI